MMDAQEMKERIFLHCCIARELERDRMREGHISDFPAGVAMGRALGIECVIKSLGLTEEYQKWSEDYEKNQNSKKA